MYAIIETGGKQYKVKKGDVIDIELLNDTEKKQFAFDQVLFINDGATVKIGQPRVTAYKVIGEIIDQVKGPKVVAYKYKQRKNYRRKVGHRQSYSRVKIVDITSS